MLDAIYSFFTETGESLDGASYPKLPLTGAALPVLLIDLAYLSFIFKIGPWFMKHREPYNLKKVLLLYNFAQILMNLYMAIGGCCLIYYALSHDLFCMQKLPEFHPMKKLEATLSYVYVVNKFIDYLDTIFFVLRKSYKQVSFLHVYHHLLMTTTGYLYHRSYGYGGHALVMGVLNSFVHCVMYGYYLVSALQPVSALWWKRYITEMQIVQFVLIFLHQSYPIVFRPDCGFPKVWMACGGSQAVIMLFLFGKFYKNTYLQKKPKIA